VIFRRGTGNFRKKILVIVAGGRKIMKVLFKKEIHGKPGKNNDPDDLREGVERGAGFDAGVV
jgi:hypothetical protein